MNAIQYLNIHQNYYIVKYDTLTNILYDSIPYTNNKENGTLKGRTDSFDQLTYALNFAAYL